MLVDGNGFVGMSDDKLRHSKNVAEQCYILAKDYLSISDVDELHRIFLAGFLHDVGYFFTGKEGNHSHALIGAEMVSLLNVRVAYAIKLHDNVCVVGDPLLSYIIRAADLCVNAKGQIISPKERIADIKKHYGEASNQAVVASKNFEYLCSIEAFHRFFDDIASGVITHFEHTI